MSMPSHMIHTLYLFPSSKHRHSSKSSIKIISRRSHRVRWLPFLCLLDHLLTKQNTMETLMMVRSDYRLEVRTLGWKEYCIVISQNKLTALTWTTFTLQQRSLDSLPSSSQPRWKWILTSRPYRYKELNKNQDIDSKPYSLLIRTMTFFPSKKGPNSLSWCNMSFIEYCSDDSIGAETMIMPSAVDRLWSRCVTGSYKQ